VRTQILLWKLLSSQITSPSNKPSVFHAHVGKARQPREPQQAQNLAKCAKISTNCQEKNSAHAEEDIIDGVAGSNWSQILDHGSQPEEEVVERRKLRKVVPYQLQQWAFETSNANITLAERLEKSKWNYESVSN
jgi:hypothetical protein